MNRFAWDVAALAALYIFAVAFLAWASLAVVTP
jgi:hypothetical protein